MIENAKIDELKFEEALAELERIVASLENQTAPLDESIDFVERIRNVVDFYFGILELDERLAPFIVNELIMNPGRWDKFRDRYLRNESRSSAFNRFPICSTVRLWQSATTGVTPNSCSIRIFVAAAASPPGCRELTRIK